MAQAKDKYFVEDGHSIMTGEGVKAPHEEVTAQMCGHSDNATLDYLADKQKLYKAKKSRPEEQKEKDEKAANAKPPAPKKAANKKAASGKDGDNETTGDGDK